jgi:hypothetical protein
MFPERSVPASPFTSLLGIELLRCWDGEGELLLPVRSERWPVRWSPRTTRCTCCPGLW